MIFYEDQYRLFDWDLYGVFEEDRYDFSDWGQYEGAS